MSRALTGPDVLARIGVLTDALTRAGLTATEITITPDTWHGVRVTVTVDPAPYWRRGDGDGDRWTTTASTVLGEVGCPASGKGSPIRTHIAVHATPTEGGITYSLALDARLR